MMIPRCLWGLLLLAFCALGCVETPVPSRVSPTEPESKQPISNPNEKKDATEKDKATEKRTPPKKEKMPDMPVIPKGDIG